MKVYNAKGVHCFTDAGQLPLMLENGWSRSKPEVEKPKIVKVPEKEPEKVPEVEKPKIVKVPEKEPEKKALVRKIKIRKKS